MVQRRGVDTPVAHEPEVLVVVIVRNQQHDVRLDLLCGRHYSRKASADDKDNQPESKSTLNHFDLQLPGIRVSPIIATFVVPLTRRGSFGEPF